LLSPPSAELNVGTRERTVLRITSMNGREHDRTLRIEGRVAGAEVEELSRAASLALAGKSRLVLDMAGVTFIDRIGLELLHGLSARGAELRGCSPFIERLLNGESE
jgi:anti-anti-sigma regulatory factor